MFERDVLDLLASRQEIVIETARPDGAPRRTRIWVVVVDGRVYVRSVRGDRGHWYQAALDDPDAVAIGVAKRSIAARAIPARDEAAIEQCSSGLLDKYAGDPAVGSMLRPETLETTLILEPR